MRRGHWIAIDCAVGGFIAVCALIVGGARCGHSSPAGQFPLALLILVAVFFPVALRRLAPVIAFGALLILGVLLFRASARRVHARRSSWPPPSCFTR